MSEQVNYFGQFVGLVAHVRILDHIRSQVYKTVVILIANFAHFVLPRCSLFNFTLLTLNEVFPSQDRLVGWNLIVEERGVISGPSGHHWQICVILFPSVAPESTRHSPCLTYWPILGHVSWKIVGSQRLPIIWSAVVIKNACRSLRSRVGLSFIRVFLYRWIVPLILWRIKHRYRRLKRPRLWILEYGELNEFFVFD